MKPPYSVPTMDEIAQIPWNGFNVVSTFSGAGGSCTGYRMAGYRVLWANEFVPAAQESYRANYAKTSILDPRDIRLVQPSEILAATGLSIGDLDLFDGSPPCQAFSTAGRREKGWGKEKSYEHGATQKNETLFTEYIRLLRGLRPKVFVAENVSGLIKGKAKGFFLDILRELKASGYRVRCRVLDAQWLGVPQTRQRTIFVGVRDDLDLDPVHPKPLGFRYSVKDVLPHLVSCVHDTGGQFSTGESIDRPCPAVMAQRNDYKIEARIFHESGGFSRTDCTNLPAPTITAAQCRMNVEQQIIVGNVAFESKWGSPNVPNPTVMASGPNKQGGFVRQGTTIRKFTIAELKRICAFPDDFILCGSYAQQWERLGNSVPPVMMKHIAAIIRDEILRKIPSADK